jgi:hypothetical protein
MIAAIITIITSKNFCGPKLMHDPHTLGGFNNSISRKSERVFFFKLSRPSFMFRSQKNLSWLLSLQNHRFLHVHFDFFLPSIARIADNSSWFGLSNYFAGYFMTFTSLSDSEH